MAADRARYDAKPAMLRLLAVAVVVGMVLWGPLGWMLLVAGAVALAVAAGRPSTDGDGTGTANCPGCGTPVEYEGHHCADCRTTVGDEAGDADASHEVEGVYRR